MSIRRKNPCKRLKHNLKEVLFPSTGRVRASEIKTLKKALDVFAKYETSSEETTAGQKDSVFERLLRNLGDRFGDDYPFYLILAHQVQQKGKVYKCDEMDKFVKTCINIFESLEQAVVAKTLTWFTTQVENEPTYVNNVIDVFAMLEDACIGLMELSFEHTDSSKEPHHREIARRMLWISCAMRCHRVSSGVPKYWIDQFTWALKETTCFDVECVRALGKGLQLGREMGIPEQLHLNSGHVKSLVVADRTVRSFTEMLEIANILNPFVDSTELFVSIFLQHPRTCCEDVLQKEDSLGTRLSSNGTSSIVVQGLSYLEDIAAMHRDRLAAELKGAELKAAELKDAELKDAELKDAELKDAELKGAELKDAELKGAELKDAKLMDAEFKAWLLLLVQLVDASDEVEDLKALLARKHSLSERFYDCIEEQVIAQHKLSIKKVFSVYDVTRLPYKFLEKYLQTHRDADVSDPSWSEFFTEAVRKYPGAEDNELLLDFLRSAAATYQARGEAEKFVLDLLRLNMGKDFVRSAKNSSRTPSHRGKGGENPSTTPSHRGKGGENPSRTPSHHGKGGENPSRTPSHHWKGGENPSTTPSHHGKGGENPSTTPSHHGKGGENPSTTPSHHGKGGENPSTTPSHHGKGGENPSHLATEGSFQSFLQTFVKENNLQEILLLKAKLILDSIVDDNDFQSLVLELLQREAVLAATSLKGAAKSSVESLLEPLYAGGAPLHNASSKLKFCWGTVAAFCEKIHNSTEDLGWAKDYYGIVEKFGWIYSTCCEESGLQEEGDQRLMLEETSIPHDVLTMSESIVTFYRWIQRAHRVLYTWHNNFRARNLTYDEVSSYKSAHTLVNRIAIAVCASKLLIEGKELKEYIESHTTKSRTLAEYMICQIPDHPEIPWRTLPDLFKQYRVELPHDLLSQISRYITFPPDNTTALKDHKFLKASTKLHELESLVKRLDEVLQPLVGHLPRLLFFSRAPSKIVTTCLTFKLSQRQADTVDVEHFADAFNATVKVLAELVKGSMTYASIGAAGLSDMGSFDFDYEFEVLDRYIQCVNPSLVSAEVLKGIKCMLQLFLLPNHIKTIKDVCEQYQLKNCLSDPTFKELDNLATELSDNKHSLTPSQSVGMMDRVKTILCLKGKISWKFMNLFSAVAESKAFYQFIVVEKKFVGEEGSSRFRQTYDQIRRYLQHEEYNEAVCNHLYEAFFFIFPFTDKQQDFRTLMTKVGSLVVSDEGKEVLNSFTQLQTVNRNIHLIQRWFSRLEKNQPLDVISTDFESIVSTGCFEYTSAVSRPMAVTLRFNNSSGEMRLWSDHEIRTFVRGLQLSDPVGDSKDKVEHFLYLHETVQKIVKVYEELRALAHRDYLQEMNKQILVCNCTSKEAEEKLATASHSLSEWRKEVTQLHKQFPQLLFFSAAKLVHLSQMLALSDTNVGRLAQEVSYLFQPKARSSKSVEEDDLVHNNWMKELEEQVKILLDRSRREQEEGASIRTPLHTLGFIISEMLPKYGLRSRPRAIHNVPQSVLYACTDCTQYQLISLIVSIYRGAPEVYEILHCQPSTSREELSRFINPGRHTVQKKQPSIYLFLEVNLLPCELQEMLLQAEKPRQLSNTELTSVGFLATGPTVLENMIAFTKYYNEKSSSDIDDHLLSHLRSVSKESISKIELVYGNAGDGKSHYIEGQLKTCPRSMCVVINEAFTIASAVQALNQQALDESHCGIWFNVTLLPPGKSVDETERKTYKELVNTIGWFFFHLFILGYVEDPISGKSFSLPKELSLEIYVEVPSLSDAPDTLSLERFQEQMPTLKILGIPHLVPTTVPYLINEDVKLVCRYLKALMKNRAVRKETPDDMECHALLDSCIPDNMKKNKSLQRLFIKYMTHRCVFLDSCEDLLHDNPDLRAVLLKTMLSEISGFCDPDNPYHQLVYDTQGKQTGFTLMTLHPDQLAPEDLRQFKKAKIHIPSVIELCSRDLLDKVLSQAIGLPLNEDGRLTVVDESSYVLTSDFVVKMLNIHERARCKVPVVLEGETGVGKTALIEMMSKLWNLASVQRWNKEKEEFLELIRPKLLEVTQDSPTGEPTLEQLVQIGNLTVPGATGNGFFYSQMRNKILQMKSALCLLEISSLSDLINSEYTPKATAKLAHTILNAGIRKTFHKLNVHSGLKPADIKEFFEKVFQQARDIQSIHTSDTAEYKTPFVTVFLDEVNTSSCLGLLKEIIVDRTLEGMPVPKNVFVLSACNPHHGDSSSEKSTWIRGTYYVRQLHPTLQCLTWDYGALGEKQEGDYFKAKLQLSNRTMGGCDLANFTSLVMKSQKLVRSYALEQLRQHLVESEASTRSRSSVSQRDIQRVFVFYDWLMRLYTGCKPQGEEHDYSSRAILVTLAIVYYIRLDTKYRERYQKELDPGNVLAGGLSFVKTFNEELEWFVKQVDFPKGIPKTQALKENLFAVVACTMTHTPLIIVGAPGTSNISFDIALTNFRGLQSKKELFQKTSIFKCLEQQFYQCSHHTTSNEITKVFTCAMSRQNSHASVPLPIYCVVFMNEAGFPEEKLESLKVLHYFLDGGQVSFVAISNHVLDAAKTNRAVSLYQPETSKEDLVALLNEALDMPASKLQDAMVTVNGLCSAYQKVMEDSKLRAIFGIQDFIHFVKNLHHHHGNVFSPDVVMKSLEENFNGVEPEVFNKMICVPFLKAVKSSPKDALNRSITQIITSALSARASDGSAPQDLRYKMLIDPSEDGSLVMMLLSCDVLKRPHTRVYMCSDFPGDTELQKIQNIKAIQESIAQGRTVGFNQTDSINDSFYDVFSRRFEYIDKKMDDPRSYYANIVVGSHIRQCQVHPNFECILVVKKSELDKLPTAFLGLFEKYYLTHSSIVEAVKLCLPEQLRSAIKLARKKAEEFVAVLNRSNSIFGLQENTLDSILFSILPPVSHTYKETPEPPPRCAGVDTKPDAQTDFLMLVLDTLRKNGGFRMPECSRGDIAPDKEELLADVGNDIPNRKDVIKTVLSSMRAMYSGHLLEKDGTLSMATVIISVFQRWLAKYLCNRLLQLVKPEALYKLHGSLLPSSIKHYFDHQHHFSLKSLISYHGNCLQASQGPSSHVKKVLCFTRSSEQLFQQLPAQHPTKSRSSSPKTEDCLHQLVSDGLEGLVVHRVSQQSSSFSQLNDDLNAFCQLDTQHTMLLTVKYQEVSASVVSHLRVLVEEAENKVKDGARKLFVLLIHYPQMQTSTSPTYLSTFSCGWDLYYLDTIGRNVETSVADVVKWLKSCCGVATLQPFANFQDGGVLLNAFLKASAKMSPSANRADRSTIVERVLSKGVGEVLIKQFASYWSETTAEGLLQEITDAHCNDVAIGIHDCVQSKLRELFFDFVYYMALQMNEGKNLDLLIYDHHHPDVTQLFIDLLKIYPVPTLKELKDLHQHMPTKKEGTGMSPRFPFFVFVSSKVEELVSCSIRQLNQRQYLHSGAAASPGALTLLHTLDPGVPTSMVDIVDLVSGKLSEVAGRSTILDTVMQALGKSNELWLGYFEDYIHHRVQPDYDCNSVGMKASTERILQLPVPYRLARLHVYFSAHSLGLPCVVATLKPLDNLVAQDSLVQASLTGSLVSSWDREGEADSASGLGSFVVDSMFDVLLKIVDNLVHAEGKVKDEDLKKWYQVYQEVLLMPSLKHCMYRQQSTIIIAKFNLLHMMYLLLGSFSPGYPDTEQIRNAVNTFHTFRFTKSLAIPELKDMAPAALDGIPGEQEGRRSRIILEGLLDHYLAEERSELADRDCEWFLETANKQRHWQLQNQEESRHFSLSVFKFHLRRIMSRHSIQKEDRSEILFHQQGTKVHQMIIRALAKVSGGPDHYIPTFYIKCNKSCKASENALMQQPLSHLYFVTVFEWLLESGYELPALVRVTQQIRKKCEASDTPVNDRILLYIEEQAAVQAMIQKLAKDFNLNDSDAQYNVLSSMLVDVNKVLDDSCTGGGEVGGHGLALVMCMLAKLGSFGALRELLVDKYGLLCEHITCLQPFNCILSDQKTTQDQGRCALIGELGGEFQQQYTKVSYALFEIHKSSGIAKMKDIVKKSAHSLVVIQGPSGETCTLKGLPAVQMSAWLCIFQEFWTKNIPSPNLTALKSELKTLLHDNTTRHIERFLEVLSTPKKDSTNSRRYDPIMALFNPSAGIKAQGLQQALLYLVTMAVGSHSKHWYQVFANYLIYSPLPGSMEQSSGPSPNERPFEVSMSGSLSPTRKPQNYSYPSHQFILWTGFAGCCLWLLVHPETGEEHIAAWIRRTGGGLSGAQSIQHYCTSKLKGVWEEMLEKLCISVEELVFLIQSCLFKVFMKKTSENLDCNKFSEYWDRQLQERLFDTHCNSLKDEFKANYSMLQCSLLEDISKLNTLYPWFPNEKTLHNTLSIRSTGLTDPYHLLSKFILGYEQLRIAGQVLPGLLELYQWMHTELANTLSREDTDRMSIGGIVKEVSRNHSFSNEEEVLERFKAAYNKYLCLRKGEEAVKRERSELLMDTSKPLIDFLSVEGGRDLLYNVILNMVDFHNEFIKSASNSCGRGDRVLHPYLLPSVQLSEFNQSHCIVRSSDENHLLEMIRKRSQLSMASLPQSPSPSSLRSNLPGQLDTLIDLTALQEDILTSCIAGKPLIEGATTLRIPFKFSDPELSNGHSGAR